MITRRRKGARRRERERLEGEAERKRNAHLAKQAIFDAIKALREGVACVWVAWAGKRLLLEPRSVVSDLSESTCLVIHDGDILIAEVTEKDGLRTINRERELRLRHGEVHAVVTATAATLD